MKRGLVLALVLLAGCTSGGQRAASPTTTSPTTTTTTLPDPAAVGCPKFREEPNEAVEMLVLSRDQRIVEAAQAYRDASGIDIDYAAFSKSIRDIVEACAAAGYLP